MNKLLAVAATDVSAETEGKWFTFNVEGSDGFRVKIKRAGTTNPAFMKLQEEVMRPYRESGVDSNRIESEKQREIARKLYSETIVTDWNADDFGIPFSKQNVYETMKRSSEFQDWLVGKANASHEYRLSNTEQTSGE